jgi:hypothetical protein
MQAGSIARGALSCGGRMCTHRGQLAIAQVLRAPSQEALEVPFADAADGVDVGAAAVVLGQVAAGQVAKQGMPSGRCIMVSSSMLRAPPAAAGNETTLPCGCTSACCGHTPAPGRVRHAPTALLQASQDGTLPPPHIATHSSSAPQHRSTATGAASSSSHVHSSKACSQWCAASGAQPVVCGVQPVVCGVQAVVCAARARQQLTPAAARPHWRCPAPAGSQPCRAPTA